MKKYTILLLLLLGAVLTSCVKEQEIGIVPADTDQIKLSFALPANGLETRALLEANEELIETGSLRVLSFMQNAASESVYSYEAPITGSTVSGDIMTITATVRTNPNYDQRFVVLVNCSSAVDAAAPVVNEKLETVMKRLVVSTGGGEWPTGENGTGSFVPFPMYAKTDGFRIATTMTNPISTVYPLIRMVARIDISVSSTLAASDFELTSASLVNYKTGGYVSYEFSGYSTTTQEASQAAVPTGGNHTGDPILDPTVTYLADNSSDPRGRITGAIYTFEAPKTTGLSEWLTTAAVVIGAKYKGGTETFYRIKLKTTDDATTSLTSDILRNHLYEIEIQSAAGFGAGTVIDAYKGGVTLTATVKKWNLAAQNITDGRNFLTVNNDKFQFVEIGETHTLTAVTDFTEAPGFPGGLQIDNIEYSSDGVNFAPAATPAAAWLTRTGVDNGQMSNTITLTAPLNNVRKRWARFYVQAGNFKKLIHIEQGPILFRREANSYIIHSVGEDKYVPIRIPISQIARAVHPSSTNPTRADMKLPSNWLSSVNADNVRVMVMWSDVNDFSGTGVIKKLTYNKSTRGNLADGTIDVYPGGAVGNAIVAIYENRDGADKYTYNAAQGSGDDRILWTWHIWSIDHHPYSDYYSNNLPGSVSDIWLDRNLGATMNAPASATDNVATHGFFYQWGRKDPHPSSGVTYLSSGTILPGAPLYFNTNEVTGMSNSDYRTITHSAANNLAAATRLPMTRFYCELDANPICDWYTNTLSTEHAALWGVSSLDNVQPPVVIGKSAYDPCPEGYRVPILNQTDPVKSWIPWETSFVNEGSYGIKFPNKGEYYPLVGQHEKRSHLVGFIGNTFDPSAGSYWTAIRDGLGYSIVGNLTDPGWGVEFPSYSMSAGFPVRCVSE